MLGRPVSGGKENGHGEREDWAAVLAPGSGTARGEREGGGLGLLGCREGKVGLLVWDGKKGSGPWAGLSAGFSFLFAKTN